MRIFITVKYSADNIFGFILGPSALYYTSYFLAPSEHGGSTFSRTKLEDT